MKRSKFLFPTLTCLTLAPAIVSLSSCNNPNIEQQIIDAILQPARIKEEAQLPKSTFAESYDALSIDEKKAELLYDTFGLFNIDKGTEASKKFNINKLYLDQNEGGFKINVTNYNVVKESDSKYYATLLGYVSYVFGAQHKADIGGIEMTFNANDYIMMTFDFSHIEVVLDSTNNSILLSDDSSFCLGFHKYRYHDSKGIAEKLEPIGSCDTSGWDVKNSKRWKPA